MSLLWFDGLDTQDLRPYIVINGGGALSWQGGRFGGYGFGVLFGTGTIRRYITPSAEIYAGIAYSYPLANNSPQLFQFHGDGGATTHLCIYLLGDGTIQLWRGADNSGSSTLLATAPPGTATPGAWQYYEMHVKIADSGGIAQVRVGGVPTNVIDFTGDTKNGGTSTNIDAVTWNIVNSTQIIDDIYVFDALGSRNNTWHGDGRVSTIFPAGAGSATDLVPSAGANYTTVDEVAASAADYNGSATSGAKDLYAMNDITAAAVTAVKTTINAHKSDTGAKGIKPAMKIGSTVYYGPTMALTTSMAPQVDLYEVSPATSAAWTPTEVNGMEFGAEVV